MNPLKISKRLMVRLGAVLILFTFTGAFYAGLFAGDTPPPEGKTPVPGYTTDPVKARGAIQVNPMKQQIIGIRKMTVRKRKLVKTIRTVGRVEYDERRLGEVNLKVEGWVETLYADYTGKYVARGTPLFRFYSPDLLNAQEEYLLAARGGAGPGLKSSARERLLLWDVSAERIEALENSGRAEKTVEIFAPQSGHVISKSIVEGGHVEPGQTLFEIADLSRLWVLADIFEYELPFVEIGQEATITVKSFPDQPLSGKITYIHPNLDLKTRSVPVRMEIVNPEGKFKPGMFANVRINVDAGTRLAIPESAVLDSGTRKVVFVSRGQGVFVPRPVRVGVEIDGWYPLRGGLREGEVVVTSANFFLDSESRLTASSEGMMGLVGMGDWKMEHSKMGGMDMDAMQGMNMKGMKMQEGSGARPMESMKKKAGGDSRRDAP